MAIVIIKKNLTILNMFTLLNKTKVGRSKDNDLIIPEDYFSREHFLITKENDYYILEILSTQGLSLNTTSYKNGAFKLKNGDIIEVGNYEFQFKNDRDIEFNDTIDLRHLHQQTTDNHFYILNITKNKNSKFFLFKKSYKTYFEEMEIDIEFPLFKIDDKFYNIEKLPFQTNYNGYKINLFTNSESITFFKKHPFYEFYSVSNSIINQYLHIWIGSHSDFSIFINGETGTGKDVMAKTIHKISERKGKFVALNCASIQSNLWESELFGHLKGSFTGSDQNRNGAFQEANGGTLFLDEIGDMPIEQQAKLLRVLETKKVKKLGSDKEEEVDVRIVCATHKNIFELVEKGLFREDLLHRIYVLPIKLLPLRERKDDVLLFANLFLENLSEKMGKKELSNSAVDVLNEYLWPGNVRELKNTIERSYLIATDNIITAKDIHFFSWKKNSPKLLDEIINQAILESLIRNNFNRKTTYEELGISRTKLYRWMDENKNLLKGFNYE